MERRVKAWARQEWVWLTGVWLARLGPPPGLVGWSRPAHATGWPGWAVCCGGGKPAPAATGQQPAAPAWASASSSLIVKNFTIRTIASPAATRDNNCGGPLSIASPTGIRPTFSRRSSASSSLLPLPRSHRTAWPHSAAANLLLHQPFSSHPLPPPLYLTLFHPSSGLHCQHRLDWCLPRPDFGASILQDSKTTNTSSSPTSFFSPSE